MSRGRRTVMPWSVVRSVGVACASVLAVSLLLPGCNGSAPSSSGSTDIKIGHYGSMTGSEATFGQSTDHGIQLAVDEINRAGGVKGRKIKLVTYDDKGESKEAGIAVTRLITGDQVVAVLGEVASALSLVGAPVCQEMQVPMVSPSSTNPKVTKVGNMIFRVCFIDPFQGGVCAKFAYEHEPLKARKAAILADQASPYSTGLADEFEKAFIALGGTIVSEQTYQAGDQDFSAQLTAIRSAEPDVVFVPGYYTDVGNIALQARRLEITVPLMGGDGWDSSKLAEIAGEAIEGCFYSNHYSQADPNPRVQKFISEYKARYNEAPDGLAALGYDAAAILFNAMDRAPSLSGTDLAKALGETRSFDGVTGRISIDADRNAVKPAVVLEYKGGTPTYVTTIQP